MPKEKRKYYRIQSYPPNKDLDRFLSLVWYESLPFEEWREIPFTEGMNYVSTEGRVISIRQNKAQFLHPFIGTDGYYYVDIKYKGQKKYQHKRVNILVAQAFLPNPENKPLVHHRDCNKLNNRVVNLVWLTPAEHAKAHRVIEAKRQRANER